MRLIEYSAVDLAPVEWQGVATRAFNAAITEVDGGYAIAYRVVHVDAEHRRIATARLDEQLALVPGSVVALSDEVEYADDALPERARTWHADPVYARLKGRLYLIWNDGGARPANHQFIAPMTDDGQHFAGPAKELTTLDRRDIEKNWTLFEVDGEVYATYSFRPHRVLRVDLDTAGPTVVGHPIYASEFDSTYERIFGVIRGGTQPVRVGDSFLALAHSSYKLPEGRVYRGALVEFEAKPPFRITHLAKAPFDLPSHVGTHFQHEKLNPDVHEVIYPRGLARGRDGEWIVSYGLNDEACAIAVMSADEFGAGLGAEVRTVYSQRPGGRPLPPLRHELRPDAAAKPELPVFWFDAKLKLFDGFEGGRRFVTGNFGDIASAWAARQLSGVSTRTAMPGEPRLLAIGSVLQRAQDGDVVWGSGVKGGSQPLRPGIDLDVRAVRGPLSVEYLQEAGVSTDRISHLFDPGALFPHLYADQLEAAEGRGGDRIVPHYHDDLMMRRRHYEHLDAFVSVDTTPLGMMQALKGADRVFSSSLHGIIFAEAMGIPAYWLAPIGGEDELKYYDYYYGTGRTVVKRFESLDEAMRSDPMELPEFDIEGYLQTFPHDTVERLSAVGIRPGQRFEFKDWKTRRLQRYFALSGFRPSDRGGVWMTSPRGAIGANVLAQPGEALEVTVTFTRVHPHKSTAARHLRAQANGGPLQLVSWRRVGGDRVEVSLAFTAQSHETALQIDLGVDYPDRDVHVSLPTLDGTSRALDRLRRLGVSFAGKAPAMPAPGPTRHGQLTALRVSALS